MTLAVATSQVSDNAMKSPNEDILSAPRARAYAIASGDSSYVISCTMHNSRSPSEKGTPTAAPEQ